MKDKIKYILNETLNLSDECSDSNLTMEAIANWDSLKHMELIITLENAFNISLDIDDIAAMTSYAKIIEIIERKHG